LFEKTKRRGRILPLLFVITAGNWSKPAAF